MGGLRFAVLGRLRIIRQGNEVAGLAWPTVKTRDFLALLVHCGEAVSRDTVLASLWADADPGRATGIFHTTVYYLRRVLDELGCQGFVTYKNRQYRLPPDGFVTDQQEFQELLAAGRGGGLSQEEATACLEQAVALYGGDYLAELDYPWLLPRRDILREGYAEALVRLGEYYLERREYGQAIARLLGAERVKPCGEQVHALLMYAFAGQGDRQAVRRQYRKLAAGLKIQLGVDVSPAMEILYRKLMKNGSG